MLSPSFVRAAFQNWVLELRSTTAGLVEVNGLRRKDDGPLAAGASLRFWDGNSVWGMERGGLGLYTCIFSRSTDDINGKFLLGKILEVNGGSKYMNEVCLVGRDCKIVIRVLFFAFPTFLK